MKRRRGFITCATALFCSSVRWELSAMRNHLSAVDLGYRLPDDHLLFTSLTFSFSEIRSGLVGANGVGKTTLLEILVGNLLPSSGSITRSGRISYARIKGRHELKVENALAEVKSARNSVPIEHQITIDLKRPKALPNKRMIEVIGVNYRFPDAQQMLWPEPLNFEIFGSERVWLKGPNGSGKSTLIDLISGRKQPSAGIVRLGTERIGLLDQQAGVLDDSLTVLENIKRFAPSRPEHELRTLLGRFLFIHDDALKPAAVLSGGERMRAALACLLGSDQSPEIVIADEPTNNLDLPSIEELVSAMSNYRGALIVVSHDITFLEEIGMERAVELTLSSSL
jgi:ATPase subunit of ABC transporter with duplicated ATPase domains